MGRSYNLKNSPINKGTAAKPSPMTMPPAIVAALVGSAASGLISGVSGLFSSAKNKKAQKELAAQNRKDNADTAFNTDFTSSSANQEEKA